MIGWPNQIYIKIYLNINICLSFGGMTQPSFRIDRDMYALHSHGIYHIINIDITIYIFISTGLLNFYWVRKNLSCIKKYRFGERGHSKFQASS